MMGKEIIIYKPASVGASTGELIGKFNGFIDAEKEKLAYDKYLKNGMISQESYDSMCEERGWGDSEEPKTVD